MPQMSPLLWLIMLIIFVFCVVFLLSSVYFMSLSYSFKISSYKVNHLFWLW